VPIATVIDGLYRATQEAEADFGIKSKLILCFVRELSAESALATIKSAVPHAHKLIGLGLDSDENGNPPMKFAEASKSRAKRDCTSPRIAISTSPIPMNTSARLWKTSRSSASITAPTSCRMKS
jgi:adenosine deaminase